jgi:F-type H+-transporting ATPase subunit c
MEEYFFMVEWIRTITGIKPNSFTENRTTFMRQPIIIFIIYLFFIYFYTMLEGAKFIAAGISTIALGGAAIGAGLVFNALINSTGRNPSMQNSLFGLSILAFALTEAIGLFAFMFAFILLFAL